MMIYPCENLSHIQNKGNKVLKQNSSVRKGLIMVPCQPQPRPSRPHVWGTGRGEEGSTNSLPTSLLRDPQACPIGDARSRSTSLTPPVPRPPAPLLPSPHSLSTKSPACRSWHRPPLTSACPTLPSAQGAAPRPVPPTTPPAGVEQPGSMADRLRCWVSECCQRSTIAANRVQSASRPAALEKLRLAECEYPACSSL